MAWEWELVGGEWSEVRFVRKYLEVCEECHG